MQVIDWRRFIKNGLPQKGKFSSMTVGVFDGVHLGHQALLKKVVGYNPDFIPVAVTFRRNHKTAENEQEKNIQSFQERLDIFEALKIQVTIVIDFSQSFRKMPGTDFLDILIKHGCVGFFAAGSKFRCGYKLDTSAEEIRSYFTFRGIPVEIVPETMEGSQPISSSRIRAAISSGDIELAQVMLGHSPFIKKK